MNVLFLCTANSCRSILAEAIFNHLAPAGWQAASAGSQPAGYVNPRALALPGEQGITAAGARSKSLAELDFAPDIVVTVCSAAAGEACPLYLGPVVRAHWGVDDPALATGSDDEIAAAFATAFSILRARITAFLVLPLDELANDRSGLQNELDRIGSIDVEAP